jgi:serine/threonine protein kinase
MSHCVSDNDWLRIQNGECREESLLDELAEHLSNCATCAQRFQRLSSDDTHRNDAGTSSPSPSKDSTVGVGGLSAQVWDEHWPPPSPLLDHPRWHVLDVLGIGGTGAVYLAENRELPGEFRALKILQPSLATRHQFAARFRREVDTMRSIPPHPNLVLGYEGEALEPYHLLVMEYVPGVDLEEYAAAQPGNRLAYPRAVGLVLQALAGLDHAWRVSGLVHRDVKPANLMLTREGIVKVLDFGLAKLRENSEGRDLTRTGVSAGTPKYCSPEQDRNLKAADIRSDLYSVGCTLFRLIAGEAVFGPTTGHESDVEIRLAHHQLPPRLLRSLEKEVPSGLSVVVDRLLAKDPDDRPSTPTEAARLLLPYAEPEDRLRVCRVMPDLAKSLESSATTQRNVAGSRWWSRMGLLTLALLGIVGVAAGVILRVNTKAGLVEIAVDDSSLREPGEGPDGQAAEEADRVPVDIQVDDRPVDRTRIKVRRAGERRWLTIEAVAGERVVRVSRPGFRVVSQQVRVESGKTAPLEVRLFPEERFQWPAALEQSAANAVSPEKPAGPPRQPVRRVASILWGSGRWEIEGDELCHYDGTGHGEQWLLFGDPSWRDYDFRFEVRHEGFPSGVTTFFRSPDDSHIQHFGFGWHDFRTALIEYRDGTDLFHRLEGPDGEYLKKLDEPIQADRWYRVGVSTRGTKTECRVDDTSVFTVTNNPYEMGRVGLRIWRIWGGKTRFRNLRVTSPEGAVLWEGVPDLPGPDPRRLVLDPPIIPPHLQK